jgi:hypothetical protein
MPHVVGAAGGALRALICKPDLAVKPEELTSDMSPVVFACWLDSFEAYYDASNMQVKDIAVQQAYFKACIQLGHFLPDLAHMTVNLRLLLTSRCPYRANWDTSCQIWLT